MGQKLLNNKAFVHSEVVKARVSERRNLARELHDEMSQYLTAMHFYASSIIKFSNTEAVAKDAEAIDQIRAKLSEIVHGKIGALREQVSADPPSTCREKLLTLITDWESANQNITLSLSISEMHVMPATERFHALYRLIQEGLTNITRHADATHVGLKIKTADGFLILTIKDDGKGFDPESGTKRFGLLGMRERVAECDGIFTINTSPDKGVVIHILLPLNQEGRR